MYSSNHFLIRLTQNWKQSLDENKFVGAALMDFSKAFDRIPHELLKAKMHANGFNLISNSPLCRSMPLTSPILFVFFSLH